MKTKQSDLVEKLTVRVNTDVISAIRQSGQSAPDWVRQAARSRLESERKTETPTSAVEKRLAALKQQIDDLKQDSIHARKEIAKLQQSDAIVQATLVELRKTLTAIQQNQVEFHRFLERIDAGFGNAFNALGSSLLVALSQQLREWVQVKEEPPSRPMPPILPRTRL